MPYNNISELPEGVRHVLPTHAQEIYLKAYDNAMEEYSDPASRRGNSTLENVARRVAWAAVKKEFVKNEETGKWEMIPGKHHQKR